MEFLNSINETLFGRVFMSGAVVNFFIVILGSAIGLLFKKGIPEKVKDALMRGMALCVVYIGITGLFEENINIIVVILSFALGAFLGEILDIDRFVNRLGEKVEKALCKEDANIAEGFVTATMLFCIGAMTVVGSIDSGIKGDNSTLYSKAVIDCVSSAALASSLGFGVMLSCFSVLIIEGGLTLLSSFVAPVLDTVTVSHMSVIGSMLIIALGLNLLGATRIKVMNYLPAIFLPVVFCLVI